MTSVPVSSGEPNKLIANARANDAHGVGVVFIQIGEEASVLQNVQVHLDYRRPDADTSRKERSFYHRG